MLRLLRASAAQLRSASPATLQHLTLEGCSEQQARAVAYALHYARDMEQPLADKFVGMYVNQWTLDYGDAGRRAVRQFLGEAAQAGLAPAAPDGLPLFVEPA